MLQVFEADVERMYTLPLQMGKESLHIVHIGVERVGRETLLEQQVLLELL